LQSLRPIQGFAATALQEPLDWFPKMPPEERQRLFRIPVQKDLIYPHRIGVVQFDHQSFLGR
jgi:hypothetical protein